MTELKIFINPLKIQVKKLKSWIFSYFYSD